MRKEYIASAGTMRLLSWHNTRHSFEPHFHDLLFLGVIIEGRVISNLWVVGTKFMRVVQTLRDGISMSRICFRRTDLR